MGNGVSGPLEDVNALKNDLNQMEKALENLTQKPLIHPILPHQLYIDGATVTCKTGINVLVGPVVGRVHLKDARVLLEVNEDTQIRCHVCTFDTISNQMIELERCRTEMSLKKGIPGVFHIQNLYPGKEYIYVFSGLDEKEVFERRGSFQTPLVEEKNNQLQVIALSGNNVFDLERGEKNLWSNVKERIANKEAQIVLHLGGQVFLQQMFDQSWTLLMRHAHTNVTSYLASQGWDALEAKTLEILRNAYRIQWNLPDIRYVLANTSNLMMWSDLDIYTDFTTTPLFQIDHENPTIQMQIIRTITRSARKLYHEYQRQLWDVQLEDLHQKEAGLVKVAEKALDSTAKVFQLTQDITKTQVELENEKKKRDIENARRVEKKIKNLQEEKLKLEKQIISYHQLLEPQQGEEFFFQVGPIGFLMLDVRSTRLEPGGSQAAQRPLLSPLQWEFLEKILTTSPEPTGQDQQQQQQQQDPSNNLQLLVLCTEMPVLDTHMLPPKPHTPVVATGDDEEDKKKTPLPPSTSWWGHYPEAQERLLRLVLDWKMERSNRDVVFLTGTSGFHMVKGHTNTQLAVKTSIHDVKMRCKVFQYLVGPITSTTKNTQQLSKEKLAQRSVANQLTSSNNPLLCDRFQYEHLTICRSHTKAYTILKLISPAKDLDPLIQVERIENPLDEMDVSTRVVLGPIVGLVDARNAIVVLELGDFYHDSSTNIASRLKEIAITAVLTDGFTGQVVQRVYKMMCPHVAERFCFHQLEPEKFYRVNFQGGHLEDNIVLTNQKKKVEASFTTFSLDPEKFQLTVMAHEEMETSITSRSRNHRSSTGTKFWHTLAQYKSLPFGQEGHGSLSLLLGGQFENENNKMSPEIQQAFMYMETLSRQEIDQLEQGGQLSPIHQRQIELLLKRVYYVKWNLPGVQQSLAHGSNLFLFNDKQEATKQLITSNMSTDISYVLQVLTKIHQKYQELLWFGPFSGGGGGQFEQMKTHVWGRFGLIYLKPEDGVLSIKTWQQMDNFLRLNRLLHVTIVSTCPFLLDSYEDTNVHWMMMDTSMSHTRMSPHTIDRLLKIVFTWKQQAIPDHVSKSVKQVKEVVFLSGHQSFGLDTLIQELKTNQNVRQFIVGPLQVSSKWFQQQQRLHTTTPKRLQQILLPSGSLGEQYMYTHSHVKRKFPSQLIQQFMILEAKIIKSSTPLKDTNTAAALLDNQVKATTHCRVVSLQDPQQEDTGGDVDTSNDKSKKLVVTKEKNPKVDEEEEDTCSNHVTFEHLWELERHIEWPKWLEVKWKKPLTEQEQEQVKQLRPLLDMDKLKRTFPSEFSEENGLVLFKEYEKSVPLMTQSIEQFHRNASTALRTLYGIRPPSSIFVLLVLDAFLNHSSKTSQQEFLTQQDIYLHIVTQVYEKSLVLVMNE